jgi:methylmalonyl-CoA/ethylmalonyl-CoA epimerase
VLPYNLDHVAVAVADLDEAVTRFGNRYGVVPLYRETVESQGVEEAMLPVGDSFVQLIAPLDPDGPVGRFLATKGEGMHHVAFAVPDIEGALAHLAAQGAQLVDAEPRPGGRGARIAFVHPRDFAGTLVELVELPSGPGSDGEVGG